MSYVTIVIPTENKKLINSNAGQELCIPEQLYSTVIDSTISAIRNNDSNLEGITLDNVYENPWTVFVGAVISYTYWSIDHSNPSVGTKKILNLTSKDQPTSYSHTIESIVNAVCLKFIQCLRVLNNQNEIECHSLAKPSDHLAHAIVNDSTCKPEHLQKYIIFFDSLLRNDTTGFRKAFEKNTHLRSVITHCNYA